MNDLLLKPDTYEVLRRVPNEWMHMQTVKEEISRATNQPASGITRRLSYLVRVSLVDQRPAVNGPEVRRINWDHRG